MSEENLDEKIIANYLAGDRESLEILIRKYLRPVYNLAYRYACNQADAEDIAQETFVKVWRQLKKFNQRKSFKIWLFAIAKNSAIDFLRRKKIIPFSQFENEAGDNLLAEFIVSQSPSAEELFEAKNLSPKLASAISRLSPEYRAVLALRHDNQLTFKEIADFLQEPLNTVKSRHRRALSQLRELFFSF